MKNKMNYNYWGLAIGLCFYFLFFDFERLNSTVLPLNTISKYQRFYDLRCLDLSILCSTRFYQNLRLIIHLRRKGIKMRFYVTLKNRKAETRRRESSRYVSLAVDSKVSRFALFQHFVGEIR